MTKNHSRSRIVGRGVSKNNTYSNARRLMLDLEALEKRLIKLNLMESAADVHWACLCTHRVVLALSEGPELDLD